MKQFYIILLWMLSGTLAWAQAPSKFYCTYGGDGIDIGYSVKEIYNRQYVVIGSTTSYGAGGSDAYMLLIDSMGNLTWQKTFGGIGGDVGKSIVFNPKDSGFVFVGFTSSFGNGGYDAYVVRTDKRGNQLWQTTLGSSDWDFGNDISFAPDGSIIICGYSYNRKYGKTDGLIAKLNADNGAIIKEKLFGGIVDDEFNVIKLTGDFLLTVAGNTSSYGDLNNDFWFFKFNSNLDSLDSKILGNPNKAERCYDFAENRFNELMFCGSIDTSFNNIGKNISYILKTSMAGTLITDFKLPGGYDNAEKLFSIACSRQTYMYYLSRRVNHAPLGIDIQPVLLDYNFIVHNATTYGNYNNDESYKIVATIDTGFVMCGFTEGVTGMNKDVCLIKAKELSIKDPLIITSINNNLEDSRVKLYYYQRSLYISSFSNFDFTYSIIDEMGAIQQTGVFLNNEIQLSDKLNKGIYFLLVNSNKPYALKFIVE